MLIAGNYTRALYVLGFAINFFLYTISGRVFREQLQFIIQCNHRQEDWLNDYARSPGEKYSLKHKPTGDMV
jgi:hypothetical protein